MHSTHVISGPASVAAEAQPLRALPADLSERIAIARFFLIAAIVVLHTPPYRPLEELGLNPMDFVKGLLSGPLLRNALPLLTMMSGFLLFHLGYSSYRELVQRKFRSLIVPLVVWNAPVAAAIYVVQRFSLIDLQLSETLHPATLDAWVNALFALSAESANFPLYFLRDLFALTLLAPLFRVCYRYAPLAGLAGASLVALNGLDGPFLFRSDLLIFFYLGGLVAAKRFDVKALDDYASLALAVLLVGSVVLVLLDQMPNVYLRAVAAPLLMWPAIGLLVGTRFGAFCHRNSGASFLIFVSHGAILALLWLLYARLSSGVPYAVFYVGAPLICIFFGIVADDLGLRFSPRIRSALLGRR